MSAIYPTPGHSDLADGGRGVTGPRAARWQWLSGSEVRPSGAGVAVAVGMAAGEAAAAGVSSAGTVAVGVALAGAGQWSTSRSVEAAVWPQRQCGSGSRCVASAAR